MAPPSLDMSSEHASVSLLERNKQLEAQLEQLEARVEQLERDLAIEKLQSAQTSAESLKRRLTYALRALSFLIMLPCLVLFYYFARPVISGAGAAEVKGYGIFMTLVPLAQCLIFTSIMPNEERLARVVSMVPAVLGMLIPNAAIFIACFRQFSSVWPGCSDGNSSSACVAAVAPIVAGALAAPMMMVSYCRFALPNLRRKDGRFLHPPRAAIANVWRFLARTHLALGAFIIVTIVTHAASDDPPAMVDTIAWLITAAALCLFGPVLFRHRNRQRIQSFFGNLGTRLEARSEANAAAAVACMVGGRPLKEVMSLARSSFRVLPFAALSESDFTSGSTDTGLGQSTRAAKLGECDAFLSHSWSDAGELKWRALTHWAATVDVEGVGRQLTVWLDKACIQQDRIEENLAVLPVYLAGCKSFVLLLGPTYCTRLWCILELFTWLRMGGKLDRIVVKPFGGAIDGGEGGGGAASTSNELEQEALRAFQNFESSRACCFRDAERQHLLGVLEAGFGTLGAFDATIRHIFKERRTSLSTRRASFDAGARVPLQEKGVAAKQRKHSDGPVQV